MDSILKCFYDKWAVDSTGKSFPLPNILPNNLINFIEKEVSENGVHVLSNKGYLQNILHEENEDDVLRFFHCNFFSYFQKFKGDENIVSEVLDDGSIYLYPIEIKNYDMLWLEQNYKNGGDEHTYTVIDTFSSKVLELLKNKKIKLLVSLPFEPINERDINAINKFKKELTKKGIEPGNNVLCISGNNLEEAKIWDISIYSINLPLYQAAKDLQENYHPNRFFRGGLGYKSSFVLPEDLNYNIKRNSKFISFNRSMNRYHRVILAHYAIRNNLLPNNIFSFIGSDILTSDIIEEKLESAFKNFYREKIDQEINEYIDEIKNLIPYELDTQNLTLEEKQGFATNNNKKEYYLDSYINITTETRVTSNDIFFSEKTYRPIANLQPFVMIGDCGILNELKNIGFKTFHPFINEKYDLEKNNNARIKMALNEILKLNEKSIDEIHEWYFSIKDILIHNQNLLRSFYDKNPFDYPLKKIIQDHGNKK